MKSVWVIMEETTSKRNVLGVFDDELTAIKSTYRLLCAEYETKVNIEIVDYEYRLKSDSSSILISEYDLNEIY